MSRHCNYACSFVRNSLVVLGLTESLVSLCLRSTYACCVLAPREASNLDLADDHHDETAIDTSWPMATSSMATVVYHDILKFRVLTKTS